jgi:hypothetical protein
MAKKFVSPSRVGVIAAILRQRPANGFEGAETRSREIFGLGQGAEDKDSIPQMFGHKLLHLV